MPIFLLVSKAETGGVAAPLSVMYREQMEGAGRCIPLLLQDVWGSSQKNLLKFRGHKYI